MQHVQQTRIATIRRQDAEAVVNLTKRRRWHKPEGEGESGGEGDGKSGGSGSEKVFKQEDVDRIVADRLRRADKSAAEAAKTALLQELGVTSADELKAFVADARKRQEAEKTEAQKATEAATAAEERAKIAEEALTAFKQQIDAEKRTATRNDAVKTALTAAGAKADKVLKLLAVDHADALNAVLKDDGAVDADKVKALVETARKAYGEDFSRQPGIPSNSGGRAADPNRDVLKRASVSNQRRIRG